MTTTRRWVVGTAVAVVVIMAAGWFLLVKPQKSKVSNLHTQTTQQEQANQLLLTKISALQAEQSQLPQQQLILQKFATEVPDTADEPALIRALSETAKGSGVDLASITPGAAAAVGATPAGQALGGAATGGALFSLPLSLAVSGSYANIESFFAGLEHLPRAFLVSTFTMAPGGAAAAGAATGSTAPNSLSATISTAVFYSTPAAGAPATAPAPAPAAAAPAGTGTTPAPVTSTAATNPAAPAVGVARQGAGETAN